MPECRVHRGTELRPVYDAPTPCPNCGVAAPKSIVGYTCVVETCNEVQPAVPQPEKPTTPLELASNVILALHKENTATKAQLTALSTEHDALVQANETLVREHDALKASLETPAAPLETPAEPVPEVQ